MSYDDRDTAAISAANSAGIKCTLGKPVNSGTPPVYLHQIQVPCAPNGADHAKLLANAIEALTRIYPGDTVWLDVICNAIPKYVQDAVDSLISFGCRIIITHNGHSTHGSVPRLSSSLCVSVRSANIGGFVWHPIENRLVNAI